MLGAAPFAACGFFKYHSMTAEQFLWAFIKSEFLYPKKLSYLPENLYYSCMADSILAGEKTGKNGALITKTKSKKGKGKGQKERGTAFD